MNTLISVMFCNVYNLIYERHVTMHQLLLYRITQQDSYLVITMVILSQTRMRHRKT